MAPTIDIKIKKVVLNIKKVRTFRNFSQEYVAAKVGVSQNGYSKIEGGMSAISLERLFGIAKALDVEIEDLLELDIANLKAVSLKKIQY